MGPQVRLVLAPGDVQADSDLAESRLGVLRARNDLVASVEHVLGEPRLAQLVCLPGGAALSVVILKVRPLLLCFGKFGDARRQDHSL